MQVKKFEAKSMKEALDLVKVHMGPEAIILSARDSHRGFGIMGEKSVEVTAAVSEDTLRKKRAAEARLRDDLRERFQKIPASKQREFINKAFQRDESDRIPRELAMAESAATKQSAGQNARAVVQTRAAFGGTRYIDIPDDLDGGSAVAQARSAPSTERVRRAAARAQAASREILQEATSRNRKIQTTPPAARPVAVAAPNVITNSAEIAALESQVRELKAVVEKFQTIPQVNMTMHPGADHGLPFEVSSVYQRLTQQGINGSAVAKLLKQAQAEMDFESFRRAPLVEAWVVRYLLGTVEVSSDPLAGRYHIFVGTTAQGKTSTLVKFASHLVLKQKRRIAIVSLDTIKVGAADQLRIYAQVLNVPFAIVRSQADWIVAEQKLKGVDHILVDCPGFGLRTMEEVEWLKGMLPPASMNRKVHYVQSTLARDEDAIELAQKYQLIGLDDVIFTRLDESSRCGLLLNFQERFKLPLHSFGMGPVIPEDYEMACKERVVDFIFKLSKFIKREEPA